MNKLAAIHGLVANALTLFRDLKSAESSPWQSLVPRELFLPVTRSPSRYCLDSDTWYAPAAWAPNMGANARVCSDFLDRFYFPENLPWTSVQWYLGLPTRRLPARDQKPSDIDHATCRSSLRRCRRPAAAASFSSSISARRNRFLWADS